MRVLSIDFDYFQNVSEDVLRHYPDGVDNSTGLSEIVWGNYYSEPDSEISKVGIMQEEFDTIKRILTSIEPDCPIMIANSHIHIYNFICERNEADAPLSVVNVDMHHDFVNDDPKLDCGNWLSHLAQRQKDAGEKFAFSWVANPVSISMYGIDDSDDPELHILKDLIMTSLSQIEGKQFDAVFICRSDTWSPPHLDKYFTELCEVARGHFSEIIMEKGIDIPRTQYLEIAKITAEFNRQVFEDFKNTKKERTTGGNTDVGAAAPKRLTDEPQQRATGGKGEDRE